MVDNLDKLYTSVSAKFDIGTPEDFRAKMNTPESRKKFYETVSAKGFDLGDYSAYESRLAVKKKPSSVAETEISSPASSPPVEQPTGDLSKNGIDSFIQEANANKNYQTPIQQKEEQFQQTGAGNVDVEKDRKQKQQSLNKAGEESEAVWREVGREQLKVNENKGNPAIQKLNELYSQLELANQGGGVAGADGMSNSEVIQQQIDQIRNSPVEVQEIALQDNRGTQEIKYKKPPYQTYGEMYDATTETEKRVIENTAKGIDLDKKLASEIAVARKEKGIVLDGKDEQGNEYYKMNPMSSFANSFGDAVETTDIGLSQLMGGDVLDRMKYKYMMDNYVYPKRAEGMGAELAGKIGGVVPLALPGALTGGMGSIAATAINAATFGAMGYGSGLYQGFSEAKQQGLSDEEALAKGKEFARESGLIDLTIGATMPVQGALGRKALLNEAERGVIKNFLAEQSVMAPAFMAGQAGKNILSDKPMGEGVAEAGVDAVLIGGIFHTMAHVKNIPAKTKQLFENVIAKNYATLSPAVNQGVKEGVITPETSATILEKAAAFKTMPELKPELEAEVLPEVMEIQRLEKEKEKAGETFPTTAIEAKIEAKKKEVAEKIGAPLTEKETKEYEKLLEKRDAPAGEDGKKQKLLPSEKDKIKHFEKRLKEAEKNETPEEEASESEAYQAAEDAAGAEEITSPKTESNEQKESPEAGIETQTGSEEGRQENQVTEQAAVEITPEKPVIYIPKSAEDFIYNISNKRTFDLSTIPDKKLDGWRRNIEATFFKMSEINADYEKFEAALQLIEAEQKSRQPKTEDAEIVGQSALPEKQTNEGRAEIPTQEEIDGIVVNPEKTLSPDTYDDVIDFVYDVQKSVGMKGRQVETGYMSGELPNGERYTIRIQDHEANPSNFSEDIENGTKRIINVVYENPFNRRKDSYTREELNELTKEGVEVINIDVKQGDSVREVVDKINEAKNADTGRNEVVETPPAATAEAVVDEIAPAKKKKDGKNQIKDSDILPDQETTVTLDNGIKATFKPIEMPDGEPGMDVVIERTDGSKTEIGKVYAEDAVAEANKKIRGLNLLEAKRGKAPQEVSQQNKVYDNIAGSKPNNQTGRIPVDPIVGETPKALKDIIFDVTKGIKQRLFFGKPMSRGAAGTYSPGNTSVKIRYNGDLDVTAHELAHSIDDHFGILKDFQTTSNIQVENELMQFSQYGSKPPKGHPNPRMYELGEGFAEWLRAYVANPAEAERVAPNTTSLYESKVHGDYKKAIDEFSKDFRTFAGASGRDMILANVDWKPENKTLVGEMLSKSEPNNMFQIGWWDKLSANFVNPMRAFEKANDYAKGIKGIDELKPQEDPELLSRLLLGVDSKASEILESGMIDSKMNVLTDANGNRKNLKWLLEPLDNTDPSTIERDMKDVVSYMVAERTVELANRFDRESVLTGIGGGIFKDVDVAQKTLDELNSGSPERLARVQEAASRYREMADDVLKYMVDKGRLSQENYDIIKKDNTQYVALQRVMETEPGNEVEVYFGKGGALGSKKEVIQSIKGSTKAIKNPYESLLDIVYKGVKESDRNEVLKAFRDVLTESRGMYEGDPKRFADIGVKAKQGDKDVIPIFIDGKPEYWKFQKDVYEALKGIGKEDSKVPDWMSAPARLLRNTVTYFPVFAAKNIVRDVQARMVLSNENSWRNAYGLKDLVGDKEHWNEVARAGGLNGGYYMKDRAHYYGLMEVAMRDIAKNKKFILSDGDALKRGWKGYTNFLSKSETVNRVAEYRAASKKAKSEGLDDYNAQLKAAMKSRDLLDFAVAGRYMKTINQIIPFTNAAVQGLRTATVKAKENPAGFAGRLAAFVVLPSIGEWIVNHRDEETAKQYEELPSYQRDMFYNFKIGDNKWMVVPKPFELSIPGSAVSRTLSFGNGNKTAFDGYAGSVAKSISPLEQSNIVPFLQPEVEAIANYDFYRDKNIIPPYENALNLSLRHTERGSRLGQAIQSVSGIDSRKIDHIIRGHTSYYGNMALKASDIGREDARSFDLPDLGFFKGSPAYNSVSVQKFMEFAKENDLTKSSEYKEFSRLAKKYFDADTDAEKERLGKVLTEYAEGEVKEMERMIKSPQAPPIKRKIKNPRSRIRRN